MRIKKTVNHILLAIFLLLGIVGCTQRKCNEKKEIECQLVDEIWPGSAANYDILTFPPYQFIAYYDRAKQMTIAQRKLNTKQWTKKKLNSKVEWDAHNYIAMALDEKGYLHVSGNMHVDSLGKDRSSMI